MVGLAAKSGIICWMMPLEGVW